MEKLSVFKCSKCGNIVELMHVGGGELVCCGEKMRQLKENTTDAAQEKHVPVFDGGKVKEDSLPGTYTDGEHTLIIADDLTFTMEKTGQNMEGEDFVMIVTGTFSEDGTFVIDGLYDGEINLVEIASEDQIQADHDTVQKAFDGGKAE